MDIVDIVRTTKSPRIYIPSYHHGPLFMKTGSSFTGILLLGADDKQIKRRGQDRLGLKLASQILISPFPFMEWGNLWKIAFTIEDKKGILHQITKSLKLGYVNILTEVSRPVYLSKYQSVEMVVSTSQLADRMDLDELETMQRIKEAILVTYLDDLYIEQIDGMAASPILMDRLDKYQSVSRKFNHDRTDSDPIGATDKHVEIVIKSDDESRLYFEIPDEWYQVLNRTPFVAREIKLYSSVSFLTI